MGLVQEDKRRKEDFVGFTLLLDTFFSKQLLLYYESMCFLFLLSFWSKKEVNLERFHKLIHLLLFDLVDEEKLGRYI